MAGSLKVRLTATSVLLVVWMVEFVVKIIFVSLFAGEMESLRLVMLTLMLFLGGDVMVLLVYFVALVV